MYFGLKGFIVTKDLDLLKLITVKHSDNFIDRTVSIMHTIYVPMVYSIHVPHIAHMIICAIYAYLL